MWKSPKKHMISIPSNHLMFWKYPISIRGLKQAQFKKEYFIYLPSLLIYTFVASNISNVYSNSQVNEILKIIIKYMWAIMSASHEHFATYSLCIWFTLHRLAAKKVLILRFKLYTQILKSTFLEITFFENCKKQLLFV